MSSKRRLRKNRSAVIKYGKDFSGEDRLDPVCIASKRGQYGNDRKVGFSAV